MRSLDENNLTNGGNLTGVFNLADAVKRSQLDSLSCAAARTCSLAGLRPRPCATCAPVHVACRCGCCRLKKVGLDEEGAAVMEAVRSAAGPRVKLDM